MTIHKQLPTALTRYREHFDRQFRLFSLQYPSELEKMFAYHVGWLDADGKESISNRTQGKSIRPSLCLLTTDATEAQWERAIPAAIALETLHNGTLILDDIQDNDTERHHRPTVWAINGIENGINAGNWALTLAVLACLELQDNDYSAALTLEIQKLISQTTLRIFKGQWMDLSFEKRMDVHVQEYLEMISHKTGALIETAILVGAKLGNTDSETIQHLQAYGRAIGLVFQIVDDLLNIWGDPEKTGKAEKGADIKRRKKTYPIVFALENASSTEKVLLRSLYQKKVLLDESEVNSILQIMESIGAYDATNSLITKTLQIATAEINQCRIPDWAIQQYEQISAFFAQRKF